MKQATEIYLSLGSNLGNREELLAKAINLINEAGISTPAVSSLFESEPWGYQSQHPFLNQVLRCITQLTPEDLMGLCHAIEDQLGRTRGSSAGYEDRTIDIDLLLYGKLILNTPSLQVPHPGIPARRFILEPMAEIAPLFVHPVIGKNILTLLEECGDKNPVSVYNPVSFRNI
ncbi:MAG TPA: 2-amino-4-hydroxy-6-hydroxymethyldihydropteridine diphosphokinase [Bacteroidales bacterium]|nr:2-amino-4-hydroxy-6-hydroxymethyldihydropteridine diphosphokinase [Bacteroidales bacterium]HRZ48921.1 2-amino-4-hydroxy-6-hydroxymethyldihydropteridine diphosphokinase [Bacteroidales bacterium]